MMDAYTFPTWNTNGRPAGTKEGLFGGNTETGKMEWFDGLVWKNADGTGV